MGLSNIGMYAGAFDPPTLGHQDIILRASKLCGKLYVAVAQSSDKYVNPLDLNEKVALLKMITAQLTNVKIVGFDGLTIDFAKKHRVDFLVRGVRDVADLVYEMQMAAANREMTGIETIFLPSSPATCLISSSLIRQIAKYGRRLDGFVPFEIERRLFDLLSPKKMQPLDPKNIL